MTSNEWSAISRRAVFFALLPVWLALGACGGGDSSSGGSSGGATSTAAGVATPATYTVGGGISGLTTEGLTLINGTDIVTPNASDTSFTFPTAVAAGTAYAVSIQLQPDAVTCTVSGGSGVVGSANVTDVQVDCASAAFTVGGTVSGLTANGLILANGSDTTGPAAGATAFIFPTKLASAATFTVTILTQPTGQTCAVSNGTGVILTSSVSNVAITCH
jgi:hypothetical protein